MWLFLIAFHTYLEFLFILNIPIWLGSCNSWMGIFLYLVRTAAISSAGHNVSWQTVNETVGFISFAVEPLWLYTLIPAALCQLAKAPLVDTFYNIPHLSHHIGVNLFNFIKLVTFHCFLKLWEQEKVTWSMVRAVLRVQGVVFHQKIINVYRSSLSLESNCWRTTSHSNISAV